MDSLCANLITALRPCLPVRLLRFFLPFSKHSCVPGLKDWQEAGEIPMRFGSQTPKGSTPSVLGGRVIARTQKETTATRKWKVRALGSPRTSHSAPTLQVTPTPIKTDTTGWKGDANYARITESITSYSTDCPPAVFLAIYVRCS